MSAVVSAPDHLESGEGVPISLELFDRAGEDRRTRRNRGCSLERFDFDSGRPAVRVRFLTPELQGDFCDGFAA
jgi:hypothetical protein